MLPISTLTVIGEDFQNMHAIKFDRYDPSTMSELSSASLLGEWCLWNGMPHLSILVGLRIDYLFGYSLIVNCYAVNIFF